MIRPHIDITMYQGYLGKVYPPLQWNEETSQRTMLREIESIRFGYGNPEWGAPKDKQVFIIKLKPNENN